MAWTFSEWRMNAIFAIVTGKLEENYRRWADAFLSHGSDRKVKVLDRDQIS